MTLFVVIFMSILAQSLVSLSVSRYGYPISRRTSSILRMRCTAIIRATRLYATEKKKLREGLGQPKGYLTNERYSLTRESRSGLPSTGNKEKPYLVLGIESSCDDTGVAIVSSDGRILSNIVYSQHDIHEQFGGIVPSLAMNAHQNNIDKAIQEAICEAGLSSIDDVDGIAVTKGPGLEICLRIGCRKAQALAIEYQKPFVTIHHLEAHCLLARLSGKLIQEECNSSSKADDVKESTMSLEEHFSPKVEYPFLTLLVSGGHTSLMICKGLGEFEVLGGTLDDSIGESFDKAARLLGIKTGGSGGAAIEALAATSESARKAKELKKRATAILDNLKPNEVLKGEDKDIIREYKRSSGVKACDLFQMKVPMRNKKGYDFSYAGLKNSFRMAVTRAREVQGLNTEQSNAPSSQMATIDDDDIVALPDIVAADLCYHFQDIAFTHLEDRVKKALERVDSMAGNDHVKCNALVVVGGVAANKELRIRLLRILQNYSDSGGEGQVSEPIPLIFPPINLCTDNGVMVAWSGIEKFNEGISDEPEGQEVVARWPLGVLLK